jgi:hypothetical protein
MRLAGVVCLSTGAVLDAAMGPHAGKGSGELSLNRRLEDVFHAGDVFLADALYCNYFLIARLQARGVDVLFEQNGARSTDFRRGERLGSGRPPRSQRACRRKACVRIPKTNGHAFAMLIDWQFTE